ncbi:CRISP [Lepeophtheirus salmonis]|nr:CRISP [Lepeophtheirus salmonis]CAF3001100.1 CRISP [Lepeophtheirus salmonis]
MVSFIVNNVNGNNSYCRISPQHTMCRYQGINSKCGNVISREVMSQAERNEIVNLHNQARSKVALGKETRGRNGPQPPAANMFELVWDNELANVAQRWADQCRFGHDSNRDVDRFRVGQNVHISYETGSFIDPNHVDWRKAVVSFYDEVALLDNKNVQSYKFDHSTGHYTQMVWSSTNKIGCGKIVYRKGKTLNKYLVCNYGAAGNILNTPMYRIGSSCSACPFGCAGKGLCSAPRGNMMSGGGFNSKPANNLFTNNNNPIVPTLNFNFPNHFNPQNLPQLQSPITSLISSGSPHITSNNNPSMSNIPPSSTSLNRPLRPQSGFNPFMGLTNAFKKPSQTFLRPQSPFGGMIGFLNLNNMPFNFGNIRFP